MRVPEQNPYSAPSEDAQDGIDLVLEVQKWGFNSAPAQMYYASLLLALIVVGGIAGRSYNIKGSGLAQYWLLIARSGTGKGIIQKCLAKLFDEVGKTVPAIHDFKGPGHIASGQGLIKWLAAKVYPVCICIFDEFGETLKQMSNPANITARFMREVLLQLWALSGESDVCDPMAYSDPSKNTKPFRAPNLTMIALTVPKKANEAFNTDLACDGFLARNTVLEHLGNIPEPNEAFEWHYRNLPPAIVAGVANLARESLELAHTGQVRNVAVTPEAEAHFQEYAKAVRHSRNSLPDVASELLGRNVEKAWKLAATLAVGCNPKEPTITIEQAQWATVFIDEHTHKLIAKFESGEVGEEAGNQNKQINEIRRILKEYLNAERGKYHNSKCTAKMQGEYVFTHKYLTDRLRKNKAFRGDKRGASNAIKSALEHYFHSGDIVRVSPDAMLKLYNSQAASYLIQEPYAILESQ